MVDIPNQILQLGSFFECTQAILMQFAMTFACGIFARRLGSHMQRQLTDFNMLLHHAPFPVASITPTAAPDPVDVPAELPKVAGIKLLTKSVLIERLKEDWQIEKLM